MLVTKNRSRASSVCSDGRVWIGAGGRAARHARHGMRTPAHTWIVPPLHGLALLARCATVRTEPLVLTDRGGWRCCAVCWGRLMRSMRVQSVQHGDTEVVRSMLDGGASPETRDMVRLSGLRARSSACDLR